MYRACMFRASIIIADILVAFTTKYIMLVPFLFVNLSQLLFITIYVLWTIEHACYSYVSLSLIASIYI